MKTRTFKQQGQGYGSAPAYVTATIDGSEVFAGTVSTVNQPVPVVFNPTETYGVDLFSWTHSNVYYSGSQSVTITVQNAPLLLTDTLADYCGNISSDFGCPYNFALGSNFISDPLSNVKINGSSYTRQPTPTGQWYWTIPAGGTLTATLNIQSGTVPPAP